MTSENTVGFFVPPKNSLLDRLRRWLFPYRHCLLPKAPSEWKDCITVRTTCVLSPLDRIRALLTGRIEVTARTVTENEIGEHITASEVYVCPPKFMERKD